MLQTRALWAVAAVALTAACGKKGPPLAPIVRIPAAVEQIAAQRTGQDVFVTLAVPATNVDASAPVDIGRVEVYGYTGRVPPPRARWVEFAQLVATIPVQPLQLDDAAVPSIGAPLTPPPAAASPGAMITILDTLTPDQFVQGRVEAEVPRVRGAAPPALAEAPPAPAGLRRFYVAIGFSPRGRPGPPGKAAEVSLSPLPDPPASLTAVYTASALTVEWAPSGGIIGSLFERPLSPEEAPVDDAFEPVATTSPIAIDGPAGPVRYNVYREADKDPGAPLDTQPLPWARLRPVPVNPEPLNTTAYGDAVELDRTRCYIVRALRGAAPNVLEGEPSEPTCITPTDLFPPVAPARLAAVADQGGISLIWEPNAEIDLAGYLVLRGEAGDATLHPLTATPVVETRFRDTRVTPGSRYVYAVVAVDTHLPVSNVSVESNRVEETAR